MLTISYYFLGLAVSVLAASVCLAKGRRAGKCVEVELDALRAASICMPTGRREITDDAVAALYKHLSWEEKAKWSNIRAMWTRWYSVCQEKAALKQRAIYSWARTLALCALLCLVGVFLEAEFDQPITLRTVLAGFRRPCPPAVCLQTSPLGPRAFPNSRVDENGPLPFRSAAWPATTPAGDRSSRQP
jgi:hypothetical protein